MNGVARIGSHGEFPPATLRQYALLADGERGALCGPHGEIVWLCAPQWHDEAVFATLLGGAGAYAVTPVARAVWGGYYELGSLIWHNRWTTDDNAVIECRDALARPADPQVLLLVRRVRAEHRSARVRVLLDVRAGYGCEPMHDVRRTGGAWTARSGRFGLRWSGADEAVPDRDGRLVLDLELAPGEVRDLVLELGVGTRAGPPPRAVELWQRTEAAWQDVPSFADSAAPRDTAHAYAVLRGLTASTGAMVAAATTSLPEHVGNGSNYDYRYAWLRDQAVTGVCLSAAGPVPLLTDAVRITTARLLEHGPDLRPAYTVNGDRVPDESTLALPGYPGATAVVGNRANSQFQLDAFGECLELLARAAAFDLLDADGRRAADVAVRTIRDRWDDEDAGIWELDAQWWTHSRLSCVSGLRAWAGAAGGSRASDLNRIADDLLADVAARCVSRDGVWQRAPHDDRVDTALLLPLIRMAVGRGDLRTEATLRAVRRDLLQDGYVYRFAPSGGAELGSDEGAFLFCGFLLALAEWHVGDRGAALRHFERNRAACGPPGLFAEEYDVRQRQLRGNLPQAFVHAMAFEASTVLARS